MYLLREISTIYNVSRMYRQGKHGVGLKETHMLAVFALEPVPMGYSAILDAVAETNGGENSVTIRLRLSRKCLKVAKEIS